MTDIRLTAHTPNGSKLGPLPAPLAVDASYVLNDTGALSFQYALDAPLSGFLGQALEIVTETSTDDGVTWTEPPNGRFLYLNDARDPIKLDAYQADCPSYIFRLTKAVVPFTSLDSNGQRVFTNATPGQILNTLFSEAQSRGAMSGMSWTFGAVNDSSGTAWAGSSSQTLGFSPGQNFYEILTGLADAGLIDFRTNGREIQVYNADATTGMGVDRSIGSNPVTLRPGQGLTEAPFRRTWAGLADTAYTQGDGTSTLIRTNGSAVTPWGRQETFVTAAGATTAGTLQVIADGALALTDNVRVERTFGLTFASAVFHPFAHYGVGEYVFGVSDGLTPAERLRVRQITLSRDGDGVSGGNTVLNDRFVEADIRQQRALSKLTAGATQGGSGGSPIGNDILPPAAVGTLTSSSSAYLDALGDVKATMVLDWADVTTNSDGTPITDLDHYEVHRRRSGDVTWTKIAEVNASQWADSPYEPNEAWEFRVCAVDGVYNRGAFSPTKAQTTAADAVGPVAPSTPVVTSTVTTAGTLTAIWNGLNSVGGAMDPDTDYVEVHVSTSSGFTATKGAVTAKGRIPKGGGQLTVTGLIEGTTYYVRFLPVDTSNNGGTQSAQFAIIAAKRTDGAVPSSPPANVVLRQFAVGGLEATWDAVTNADPVTYDVYLNQGSAVPVYNSTTFLGSTSATRFPISRKVDGTALIKLTDYYVAVKVRDGDGANASQGTAGPTKIRLADVDTISANYVYAGLIEAEKIKAGDLLVDINITTGSLNVGDTISLKPATGGGTPDPGGLKIITGGLVGGVVTPGAGLILLPADGSAALFRKVAMEADSLLVYDNFELQGALNNIKGTLKLSSSIDALTANQVTVTSDWNDPTLRFTKTGSAASSFCRGLVDDGTNYVVGDYANNQIWSWRKSDGLETLLSNLNTVPGTGLYFYSFCRSGTDYYVLGGDDFSNPIVVKYNSSWTYQTHFACPQIAGYFPDAIGADGGTLYVSHKNDTNNLRRVQSMTTTGGSPTTIFTEAGAFVGAGQNVPFYVGSADFASSGGSTRRFVFVTPGGYPTVIYNNAGTRITTEVWAPPNGDTQAGICWDGTNFRTLANGLTNKRVWKLSTIVTALPRSVKATKYDNVGTVHETALSPAVGFTHNPRQWMKVQTPAPEDNGGADDPKRIRHYIQTASLSASYFLQPDVTASPWSALYGVPTTGTATGPSAPDFSGVAPSGSLSSAAVTSGNPRIQFNGSGTYRLDNATNLDDVAQTAPSLNSPWVQFNSAPFKNGFYMRKNGMVYLGGMVKSGAVSTTIFTLPVGCRPSADLIFPVTIESVVTGAASTGTAHTHTMAYTAARLNVKATGVVELNTMGATVNTAFLSLSGVVFPAEA